MTEQYLKSNFLYILHENRYNMEYNDDLKRAISIAQSISKEFSNEKFSPAHLLKALLHKDIGITKFLESTT